jgi:hypothetical protein
VDDEHAAQNCRYGSLVTMTWLTLLGFVASAVAALAILGGLTVIGCQYCRGPWRDDRHA